MDKFPAAAVKIADNIGSTISDITLKIVVKDEIFLNPGIRKILDDFAEVPNGRKIDMFTSTGKQIY